MAIPVSLASATAGLAYRYRIIGTSAYIATLAATTVLVAITLAATTALAATALAATALVPTATTALVATAASTARLAGT